MFSEKTEDFKLVKHKSRKKGKNTSRSTELNVPVDDYTVEEILSMVHRAVEKFKESNFCRSFKNQIFETLGMLDLKEIENIVCYGLGNFSSSRCSKFQLACLIFLKSLFNSAKLYLYDPIFTCNEKESLKKLDCLVIQENEEGKRMVSKSPTIVYLPHCSKQLTNNILIENWSSDLTNCILLGNSWSDIICHTTEKVLRENAKPIFTMEPYVTEIRVENNFEYPNTFSGTSLHIFTKEKLSQVPQGFWNKSNVEFSSKHDEDNDFITALVSSKLKICKGQRYSHFY